MTQTGFHSKTGAKDLGAQFQYGLKREASIRNDRLQSVQHLWSLLARSGAPLHSKIRGIITAVWPKAMHASSGVFMPEAVFGSLRSGAMRGLRLNKAGSSPLIRLGMLHQPMLDPAGYHWRHVLLDARQMIAKMDGVHETWSCFLKNFDGRVFSGPLSTLIQLSQVLGWEIDSKLTITTAAGITCDLAVTAWAEIEMIFYDSWWAILANRVQQRDEFEGLHGFDFHITTESAWLEDQGRLALLKSCQDGTFATESLKAHWDLTRRPVCRFCGEVDTLRHRLEHCLHHAELRRGHSRLLRIWHRLPDCQRLHGLCPRVQFQEEFWRALQALPDQTGDFHLRDWNQSQPIHLFVDGTCTQGDHGPLSLAAWAVTTEVLPGLRQTISRAEATAVLSALRWVDDHRCNAHIWTDSQLTYDGITALLSGTEIDYEDSDIWTRIAACLDRIGHLVTIHKIWSHMPESWASNAFEDWWILGNARADQLAGWTNSHRPADFMSLYEQFRRSHLWARTVTRRCQEYLLAVAEAHPPQDAEAALEDQVVADLLLPADVQACGHDLAPRFPADVLSTVRVCSTALIFGSDVTKSILSWIFNCDQVAATSRSVAFIELLVGWRMTTGHHLPVQDPVTQRWCQAEDSFVAFPATLAAELAVFRRVLLGIFADFGVGCDVTQVDLRSCSIFRQVPGITLGWPNELSTRVGKMISQFFVKRPWRRGVDVARCLRVEQCEELSFLI